MWDIFLEAQMCQAMAEERDNYKFVLYYIQANIIAVILGFLICLFCVCAKILLRIILCIGYNTCCIKYW